MNARQRGQGGFTLVELLVTLTVTALLMALAAPTFRTLLLKRSVQAAADALVSDLRLARSEAVKRSATVSVCSSVDGASCGNGAAWQGGWIVFVDADGDGSLDADDAILRVQGAWRAVASIASANPGNDRPFFVFQATGLARAATQTFFITPTGQAVADLTRLVCVSSQGRAALRASGAEACG
jgi:type IV fimbrial biogenesis protein FimT